MMFQMTVWNYHDGGFGSYHGSTSRVIALTSKREAVIPLTGVLQTGVLGVVEMCLALMRKLVFRDH